jgi:hypothetical protein
MEDRIMDAKHRSGKDFFTEAALIAAWELWKIRNDRIFERHVICTNRWFSNFRINVFSSQLDSK